MRTPSRRVPLCVPVYLRQAGRKWFALTAVVNRAGALILSPAACEPDSLLTLMNTETGETAALRVVWCGGGDASGRHTMGAAFLEPRPAFWGASYEMLAAAQSERP